jgi:hypothetical protein
MLGINAQTGQPLSGINHPHLCREGIVMGMLRNQHGKVDAMVGGSEGGLSARRLKTFQVSRAHVNTLIQAAGADMTAGAR